jgi:hypothetical protein
MFSNKKNATCSILLSTQRKLYAQSDHRIMPTRSEEMTPQVKGMYGSEDLTRTWSTNVVKLVDVASRCA